MQRNAFDLVVYDVFFAIAFLCRLVWRESFMYIRCRLQHFRIDRVSRYFRYQLTKVKLLLMQKLRFIEREMRRKYATTCATAIRPIPLNISAGFVFVPTDQKDISASWKDDPGVNGSPIR